MYRGFSSGKESSSQMETGRGLARRQDGEVGNALNSEELWKPHLRNLDFYPPNYGKVIERL